MDSVKITVTSTNGKPQGRGYNGRSALINSLNKGRAIRVNRDNLTSKLTSGQKKEEKSEG